MKRIAKIDPSVFTKVPTFHRAVIAASKINNRSEHEAVSKLLSSTIETRSQNPVELKTDPAVTQWNEAHIQLGNNPNRFPPSHVGLTKRAQSGKTIAVISPLVALMNVVSISYCTSVGGDDSQSVSEESILRFAVGDERFVPLLEPEVLENPQPGELVYVDNSGNVMCRRWNWRNSHLSRITESTRYALINVDGLGDGARDLVLQAGESLAKLLEQYCGASTQTTILDANHNSFPFELEG
jgi:lysyl-tRNA synthetase class 2